MFEHLLQNHFGHYEWVGKADSKDSSWNTKSRLESLNSVGSAYVWIIFSNLLPINAVVAGRGDAACSLASICDPISNSVR